MGITCSGTLHTDGCEERLVVLLRDNFLLIGGVLLGVASVEILGIVMAVCLVMSIGEEGDEYMEIKEMKYTFS